MDRVVKKIASSLMMIVMIMNFGMINLFSVIAVGDNPVFSSYQRGGEAVAGSTLNVVVTDADGIKGMYYWWDYPTQGSAGNILNAPYPYLPSYTGKIPVPTTLGLHILDMQIVDAEDRTTSLRVPYYVVNNLSGIADNTIPEFDLSDIVAWPVSNSVLEAGKQKITMKAKDSQTGIYVMGYVWRNSLTPTPTTSEYNVTYGVDKIETYAPTQEGTWYLFTYTSDGSLNAASMWRNYVVRVDVVAPTINISYNPTNYTNQSVVATLTSDKDLQPIAGWTQENARTFKKTYTENVQQEIVTVKDLAGNTASKTVQITNIDKIVPNAFSLNYTTTTNSITVIGNTTDAAATGQYASSGIAKYQYSINNGAWQDSNVFSGLTQGSTHTISMKAIDNAGNERVATNGGMSVVVGTIPSNITIIPSETNWTNQDFPVSIMWPSNIGGLTRQYSLNGTTWNTYSNAFTVTENGIIYARLIDNTNQTSRSSNKRNNKHR